MMQSGVCVVLVLMLSMTGFVASRAQEVSIPDPGAFPFAIAGPPGVYAVLGSNDLAAWSELGFVSNSLGRVVFMDNLAQSPPQKFYRARSVLR